MKSTLIFHSIVVALSMTLLLALGGRGAEFAIEYWTYPEPRPMPSLTLYGPVIAWVSLVVPAALLGTALSALVRSSDSGAYLIHLMSATVVFSTLVIALVFIGAVMPYLMPNPTVAVPITGP